MAVGDMLALLKKNRYDKSWRGGWMPVPRKNTRNTKGRIISAAWKLFYEQGYEDTTVEDIVFESETSKGSFYHYFDGKDALLGTLAYVFDEKYEQLMETMDPEMGAMEKMIYLNHELFVMIDGGISMDLLARLLSTQLLTRGEKQLLDRNRTYFKLLRQIISEGQKNGQLRDDRTVNEILRAYALWERALLYDWCLAGGEYSLVTYTDNVTPMFLESYRKKTF
jgi:AcrR family transcriptional regulator